MSRTSAGDKADFMEGLDWDNGLENIEWQGASGIHKIDDDRRATSPFGSNGELP